MTSRATTAILGLALVAACSEEQGDLKVLIYGEEFIETKIPADVFDDGWSIEFDSFLISVGVVAVAEAGSSPALEEAQFQVFDLAADSSGAGYTVAAGTVPGGAYDETSYVVAPSSDLLAGESKAVVEAAAPATVQLTIHGDHLFADDLFSETPSVRFDLYASADTNGDGDITQAELKAVDLRPLENYQVGGTGITDLWNFIEHLTTSLGHIDGEGHCESERES